MLNFKPFELKDKKIIDGFLLKKDYARYYNSIEYMFSTFYVWQMGFNQEWTILDDHLLIQAKYKGEKTWFLPIGPNNESVKDVFLALEQHAKELDRPLSFISIVDQNKNLLEKYAPWPYELEEDRDGANYIYLQEDLANLKGRKYSSKRNHINKFWRTYPDAKIEEITEDIIPLCLESADNWYQQRKENDDYEKDLEYEKDAIYKLFANWQNFNLKGMALFVYGKVVAFTIGEAMNEEMATVHIEKADANIDGSYTLINKEFAANCLADFKYINRAEDMGDPGLRKAKQDYHPYEIAMKYTATVKN